MIEPKFNYQDWLANLDDIHDRIFFLDFNKREFNSLKDKFNAKELPVDIFRFARRNYATFMAMGVRRTVDKDGRAVSLIKLLADIELNSPAFKRTWFLEQHPDAEGEPLFEEFFGSSASLRKEVVTDDIEELIWRTKKVKDYATKWEAHWDKDRFNTSAATYQDLDMAVSCIYRIYQRYYYLLKQNSLEFR